MSKFVKISAETAARIRNLIAKMAESEDKGEEPSADLKDEAKKLAADMREQGVIKAADEEQFAEVMSTHEGALRVARRGVELEAEHRKASAEGEKTAEDKAVPPLGGGRRSYTPDTAAKDNMKAAHDKFGDDVIAAAAAGGA